MEHPEKTSNCPLGGLGGLKFLPNQPIRGI